MRSIGKRNISLVKKITIATIKKNKGIMDYSNDNIVAIVSAKLPDDLWDKWEMAHQEIQRIILDTKFEYDR